MNTEFLFNNLEVITAVVSGLCIGGITMLYKSPTNENDLTRTYIKYKKHSDNINKSAKTMF